MRRPRFSRTAVVQDTVRARAIEAYVRAGNSSNAGFVCTSATELLAARSTENDRLLIAELDRDHEIQRDAIYTALHGVMSGSHDAVVFVEPADPERPDDFDPHAPHHHTNSYRVALEFQRQLFIASECTWSREHPIELISRNADRHVEGISDPCTYNRQMQLTCPQTTAGPLLQSTVGPHFPMQPLHPRYAPVMAHAVVPLRSFVAAARRSKTGKQIQLHTIQRVAIPYDSAFLYPIPNVMEFAEPAFKLIHDVLTRRITICQASDNEARTLGELAHYVFHQLITRDIYTDYDVVSETLSALRTLGVSAADNTGGGPVVFRHRMVPHFENGRLYECE